MTIAKAKRQVPEISDEADFRRFVTECAGSAHVSHIESHEASPGIPDLNICMRGIDIWIELKVMSSRKPPKMRATQKRWHANRYDHGGRSWVITLDLDEMNLVVLPGQTAASLPAKVGIWRNIGFTHSVTAIPAIIRMMARRL